MNQLFIEAYQENYLRFQIAMSGLKKSYQHATEIGLKSHYSFEQTEVFDALIIKLSRNIDVFFQQVVKGFFTLKGENQMFFVDRIII